MDDSIATDARRDLETIRTLMERARRYRHPPASAAFVAGGLAIAAAFLTHRVLEPVPPGAGLVPSGPDIALMLRFVWGSAFVLALASCIALTFDAQEPSPSVSN